MQTQIETSNDTLHKATQTHAVFVKYMGPTNSRGSRVQLTCHDIAHRNNDKAARLIIPFTYECSDINEMVLNHIKRAGLNLNLVTHNSRHPDFNVLLFKWSFDEMCKLFKIKVGV